MQADSRPARPGKGVIPLVALGIGGALGFLGCSLAQSAHPAGPDTRFAASAVSRAMLQYRVSRSEANLRAAEAQLVLTQAQTRALREHHACVLGGVRRLQTGRLQSFRTSLNPTTARAIAGRVAGQAFRWVPVVGDIGATAASYYEQRQLDTKLGEIQRGLDGAPAEAARECARGRAPRTGRR